MWRATFWGVLSLGGRRCIDAGASRAAVRLRAAAMQEAVPVGAGAMAAILGLDSAKVMTGAQAMATFGAGSTKWWRP